MTRPLRVLQAIDSLARAGAEQSLATLAPHLVAEEIDLHVAYLIEREGLRGQIEAAGVRVVSLASPAAGRRAWLARMTDLVGELRPDVVHTTLFEADLSGRRAAARCGVPCVSSFVNTTYEPAQARRENLGRLRLRAAQAVDAYTARRVARFHAVTEHVAQVMGRRLFIPRSKIEVIPRGRDDAALGRRTADRRAQARQRLGVDPGDPLVVAVGRQEPQKGLDVLLAAVPLVRARHPAVRVVVAGREGRASAALGDAVRHGDLAGTVTFLGMRSDVPDLLAAADVFAFPSRWEGAGGTLLEAMALEAPIVTSDLATLRTTVDDSVAVLVRPDDAGALAAGIVGILDEPAAATARARAGRARFEAEFTIGTGARRMARLYEGVAGARCQIDEAPDTVTTRRGRRLTQPRSAGETDPSTQQADH
jgi:glycosyltransferase involved in cell wall biosynthesis